MKRAISLISCLCLACGLPDAMPDTAQTNLAAKGGKPGGGSDVCPEGKIKQRKRCVDALAQCTDGVDNDDNGVVDCDEPFCASNASDCDAVPPPPPPDGNEYVPGFSTPCQGGSGGNLLCYVSPQPPVDYSRCFDGIDNDGDGLTDCMDLDCWYTYMSMTYPYYILDPPCHY
jgi:hypothetical protein